MLAVRVAKELRQMASEPPPGISLWPVGDSLTRLEAQVQGPGGTVYEAGVFKLSVTLPARYPLEPPGVQFVTPILHPNIDSQGRICLDTLNMPPKGSWSPAQSLRTVLLSLQLLLGEPNPADGLAQDVAEEFLHRREAFDARARAWTRRHAVASTAPPPTGPVAATAETAGPQEPQGQAPHQLPGSESGRSGGAEGDGGMTLVASAAASTSGHATAPTPSAPALGQGDGRACSDAVGGEATGGSAAAAPVPPPLQGASAFNATALSVQQQPQQQQPQQHAEPSSAAKRPADGPAPAPPPAAPASRLSLLRRPAPPPAPPPPAS